MESLTLLMLAAALTGLAIITLAGLRGWALWLALKHRELDLVGGMRGDEMRTPSPAARIELADLKERIRKLEAIAAGVDL
jgi:hypothetical protein